MRETAGANKKEENVIKIEVKDVIPPEEVKRSKIPQKSHKQCCAIY